MLTFKSMECPICQKHKDFAPFAGEPIAEQDGLIVSHFPVLEGVPAMKGRLLIESKRHLSDVSELEDREAQALGLLIKKSITQLVRVCGAEHAYVFRVNDLVAHFHFHVVARFANTPKEFWGLKIVDWAQAPKLDLLEVSALAAKLKRAFSTSN